jgi:dolichol-phosphate mannosyltransferase
VDDGSTDGSADIIQRHLLPCIKLVRLRKNYGQSAAMAAGIEAAAGEFIVTMDADLQNDPADIPMMLEVLLRGKWDVVAGIRKHRQDGLLLRKIPSNLANRLIRNSTGIFLHDYGCTLKIFRREFARNLGLYGHLHRFIPVLAAVQGARMTEVEVRHHPRISGQSKYGMGRSVLVISDLIFILFLQKYFQRPMHIFGPIGLLMFLTGSAMSLYLLMLKIGGERIGQRPLLVISVMLILAGLQFIFFGIITEILMRTYYESQHKRSYHVREVVTYNAVLT